MKIQGSTRAWRFGNNALKYLYCILLRGNPLNGRWLMGNVVSDIFGVGDITTDEKILTNTIIMSPEACTTLWE